MASCTAPTWAARRRSDAGGLALDGSGRAYVTGRTDKTGFSDYPTTAGAFDTTHNGGTNTTDSDGMPPDDGADAFLTRLTPTGGALSFSTFLGGRIGSQDDAVADVAIDATGVYVTGRTATDTFPTTAGAFDTTRSGPSDVFVTKLDPSGSSLLYSTLLGGTGIDLAGGIAVGPGGTVFVTGNGSTGYPTTAGAYAGTFGKPVFVTKLDAAGGALLYSTRFGGFLIDDTSESIAVDAAGNAYIAGTTAFLFNGEDDQIPYPTTPGAFDEELDFYSGFMLGGDVDAFVTKLNPSGSALVYSTYVGLDGPQWGTDLALDASGNVYLTGRVGSFYDPEEVVVGEVQTTPGAFDTTRNEGEDAFVVELNPSGSALVYGTYLGGEGEDQGSSIAVGADGAAYVTGSTDANASPFPTTPGAFDTSTSSSEDAFVTKVAPGGGSLAYSTRLGGTGDDFGTAIAVDGAGAAHVTGEAGAGGAEAFPTTPDALDASLNGATDAFLTKVAPNGASLTYSGLMGAGGDDAGVGVAVDPSGRVAVAGTTRGDGFPTTAGAFDVANPGLTGAGFVSVLDLSPVPPATPSGCVNAVMSSAGMSWYPAQPGAQSNLEVACSFNDRPGASQVSPSYTIHDHRSAQYHNGAARSVVVAAAPAGAESLTAPGITGTGMGSWVDRVVTGPGLAPRTFVTSVDGDVLHLNRATVGDIDADTAVLVENAPGARSVDDASGAAASTVIDSASASFGPADVGLSISGTGIPLDATITSVNSPTQVVISAAATLVGPVVTIGATLLTTSTRTVTGASIAGSSTIGSTGAGFAATDVGLPVTGVCDQLTATGADDYNLPADTFVLATPTATDATTSTGLTAGQSGCTITIGEPNASAPQDGEAAATHAFQLDLNPAVFPGVGPCAARQPEGLALPARWYNPGSFQGTGTSNTQPGPSTASPATPGTKVVGQLYFQSATVGYSAFVIERKAATPGDPIGVVHYDVQLPFVPIAAAKCPGTTRSPGMTSSLTIHATTASQTTGDLGAGRPGTAQIRSTLPSATGGYIATLYLRSDAPGITYSPASAFQRLCVYPAGNPNTVGWQCGN